MPPRPAGFRQRAYARGRALGASGGRAAEPPAKLPAAFGCGLPPRHKDIEAPPGGGGCGGPGSPHLAGRRESVFSMHCWYEAGWELRDTSARP
jgi:hypothetical protein